MPDPSDRARPSAAKEPGAPDSAIPCSRAAADAPPLDSVPALLQLLRRQRLLNPAQLNEIKESWLPEPADAQALADRLCRGGWLTPYQAEQLRHGHAQALLLGPYHLVNLVGEGALGQVYEARHRKHRSTVALKVLHPELRTNAEVVEQFWEEPVALASLDHPAFVRAFDVSPDAAHYYFAMEYVDGIDLGKLLQLAGPLPVAQACDYVRQAALGL
jgi:serine/threonine-protein kinase